MLLFGLGLGWNFSFVAATAQLGRPRGAGRARQAARLQRPRCPRMTARCPGLARRALALDAPARVVGAGHRLPRCSAAPAAGSALRRQDARLLPSPPGGRRVRRLFMQCKDLERKARRDRAPLVRRRRRGADPGPSRDPDRRHAARQGQAGVHAARRHGRLRDRRERREDRGHRQEARPEDVLPALRLPGRAQQRTLREQLDRQPTEVLRKAVKGMLPRTGSRAPQITKLKIYAGPEHPHAAQAPEAVWR